jgi:hypothetical protein
VWRMSSRSKVCRSCGAPHTLVPLDSPRGKQLIQQFAPVSRGDQEMPWCAPCGSYHHASAPHIRA